MLELWLKKLYHWKSILVKCCNKGTIELWQFLSMEWQWNTIRTFKLLVILVTGVSACGVNTG